MGNMNSATDKLPNESCKRSKLKKVKSLNSGRNTERNFKKQVDSDSGSSEEDGNKFKAVAQANGARMSEKKVLRTQLPIQKSGIRKSTIDVESFVNKDGGEKLQGHHNTIKRGYYAKLGIERSRKNTSTLLQTSKCSVPSKFGTKDDKESKPEPKNSSLNKSLSSKNIGVDKLSISSSNSSNNQSYEESKLDVQVQSTEKQEETSDPKFLINTSIEDNNERSIDDGLGGRIVSSLEDMEEIETSYTTKDSGNWRLEMVKKTEFARDGNRIRNDLLSKLVYKKIWLTPSEKPTSHQTVFIYDWDDTLL